MGSTKDLALVAACLVGTDARDTEVVPTSWRSVPSVDVRTLRVAFAPTFPGVPVARAIRAVVEAAATKLRAAGAIVEERLPETDFAHDREIWRKFFNGFMHGLGGLTPIVFKPAHGETFTVVDWLRVLDQHDGIIRRWEAFFERWNVLLSPVVPAVAPPHAPPGTPFDIDGESVPSWRVDHFLYWFNFTGHPAVVIPAGLDSSGLPIGLQCVGPRWKDEELLARAEAIDSALGAYRPPPGY